MENCRCTGPFQRKTLGTVTCLIHAIYPTRIKVNLAWLAALLLNRGRSCLTLTSKEVSFTCHSSQPRRCHRTAACPSASRRPRRQWLRSTIRHKGNIPTRQRTFVAWPRPKLPKKHKGGETLTAIARRFASGFIGLPASPSVANSLK